MTGYLMKANDINNLLIQMIPEAKCELNYNKDYELLIATMLSAQTTDKRVNEVTASLFKKYSLEDIASCNIEELEIILKPIGTFHKKAIFLKKIAEEIIKRGGVVPNDRGFIESLPGCGHKTCNVVLSNLYEENCIAVDTHVSRVAIRLGLAKEDDSVSIIEKKLSKVFANENLKDLHHRMVLFGRYICTAKNPKCEECLFKSICQKKD